jgi:hypothetical protein
LIPINVNALIVIIKKNKKIHIIKDTATKNELKGRTTVGEKLYFGYFPINLKIPYKIE